MYIKIELNQDGLNLPSIPFKIQLKELENAIENCYTQLGTPYDPIMIDNFVTVGENAFSTIDKETKVSVSLELGSHEDNSSKIIDHKLVCCKAKIVDKKFINSGSIADNKYWEKIFKPNELSYSAPDGTLYISPNDEGKCVVSTVKSDEDRNLSYSILISLKVELGKEDLLGRVFYFILDPLVKISSGNDTNPPNNN
uniref:hypothetical protein n=1 Tax=Gelidibacter sp. TaxID=2018083 RepID=UPI00404A24AA